LGAVDGADGRPGPLVGARYRMTFAYMMNKMAAGIIGSPRAETYLRAGFAALSERRESPAVCVTSCWSCPIGR
jgi:hypothetical protein